MPPVAGKIGRPRRRFAIVQGDRAYHSEPHRREIRRRGGKPLLARRNSAHGSKLGRYRWPVERTLGWMHQPRRLRTRYEKRGDVHEAFMLIEQALICWKALHR
jgi:transposase